MRVLIVFLVIITFFKVAVGQEAPAGKWTSFETDNGDLSFSLPPGHLVDTKNNLQRHKLGIFVYSEGVRMDFRIFDDEFAKYRFAGLSGVAGSNGKAFEIGHMKGFRYVTEKNGQITERISLLAKTRIYFFTVVFDEKHEALANRFLFSISVKDQQLFQQGGQNNKAGTRINLKDISSSPEVLQAYKQKPAGSNTRVIYEPLSSYKEPFLKLAAGDCPPIVLEKPIDTPKLSETSSIPSIDVSNGNLSDQADKILVKYLANGEIGDITVYSKGKTDYTDACVEMIKKIKFLPAFVGGKSVDATVIEECSGGVGIFPVHEGTTRFTRQIIIRR